MISQIRFLRIVLLPGDKRNTRQIHNMRKQKANKPDYEEIPIGI